MDEERTPVNKSTRIEDEKSAQIQAGADRSPTISEEKLADENAEELEDSGELERVGDHLREMTHLGAEVKGEGQIP